MDVIIPIEEHERRMATYYKYRDMDKPHKAAVTLAAKELNMNRTTLWSYLRPRLPVERPAYIENDITKLNRDELIERLGEAIRNTTVNGNDRGRIKKMLGGGKDVSLQMPGQNTGRPERENLYLL